MHRSNGAARPAPRRAAIVRLLATLAGTTLLLCGVAVADTVTTDFNGFQSCPSPVPVFAACGTVNGQGSATPQPPQIHCAAPVVDCWKSAVPGNIPSLPQGYDQQVVTNGAIPGAPAPASFGAKSLRIANAYGTAPDTVPPEYHFQTYSKPTPEAAGEDLPNTVYTAQFTFISVHPNQEQPGLKISVSPDMGEGGRMSYIGLTDTPTGINVSFFDTDADGRFVPHDLGTLPRNLPHTIKFFMRLVPGVNNDLVRILIDGSDVGQCFTTWENFYRATSQSVPISDRLLFLSGNRDGNRPGLLGGGYLFDNVTTTTAAETGPPTCDVPIDKEADARTVSAGGRIGYRITVRNRGSATARNLQVCDRIPRRMTFVSADRALRRVGSRRCLVIARLAPGQRVRFRLVLRAAANAPQANVTNVADVTPVDPQSPASPTAPPTSPAAPAADLPPRAVVAGTTAGVRARRARAVVRVLRQRRARPNFTG